MDDSTLIFSYPFNSHWLPCYSKPGGSSIDTHYRSAIGWETESIMSWRACSWSHEMWRTLASNTDYGEV
jgi:hypothetical protein